jgi:hypothetical protein
MLDPNESCTPFYHLPVVSGDDKVIIALTKPKK